MPHWTCGLMSVASLPPLGTGLVRRLHMSSLLISPSPTEAGKRQKIWKQASHPLFPITLGPSHPDQLCKCHLK